MKTSLQEIQELYARIEELHHERKRIKLLSTPKGFIKCYYKACQTESSCREAFNKINEEYESYFGVEKYANYNSFKRTLNYYIEKRDI